MFISPLTLKAQLPGVSFIPTARNRKLAPVRETEVDGWLRFEALGPYVSATYVSIQRTCPNSCRFKNGNGCFAEAGYMGPLIRKLDLESLRISALEVSRNEAETIDSYSPPQDGGKYRTSGRDLRLHVSGDVEDDSGARELAGAARRWRERGGGKVWTYTHSWRTVAKESWGEISVLASCETPEDVAEARERGYVPALVVRDFRGAKRAYNLPGVGKLLPCPAETGSTTCVQCRLCLDEPRLKKLDLVIGFSVHGRDEEKARRRLPILDSLFGNLP